MQEESKSACAARDLSCARTSRPVHAHARLEARVPNAQAHNPDQSRFAGRARTQAPQGRPGRAHVIPARRRSPRRLPPTVMASERLPSRPACLLVASGAAEGECRRPGQVPPGASGRCMGLGALSGCSRPGGAPMGLPHPWTPGLQMHQGSCPWTRSHPWTPDPQTHSESLSWTTFPPRTTFLPTPCGPSEV